MQSALVAKKKKFIKYCKDHTVVFVSLVNLQVTQIDQCVFHVFPGSWFQYIYSMKPKLD